MNGYARNSWIAMLVAAEVLILGIAGYSVRGAAFGPTFATGGTGGSFVAKTFAPIAAGSAPRVTIDDPNSGVTISASTDGQVHVQDDTFFHGLLLGNRHGDYPQLTVTQDADGVHITRPAYHESWVAFGFANSRQHFEVQVPADATVAVNECDNAEVSDLKNGITIKALDGRIELTRVDGPVVAHTNDGHVKADEVTSPSLDLSSDDGWIELHSFTTTGSAPYVHLHSNDGHIAVSGVFAGGGKYDLTTSDGRINAAFAAGSDVTVDASTNDGSLRIDGVRQHSDDGARGTVRVGSGAAPMRIHSDDGSITITTTT